MTSRATTLRQWAPVALILVAGVISTVLTVFVLEAFTDRDWKITDWEWPEITTVALLVPLGALWAGQFLVAHFPVLRALGAPRGRLLPGLGARLDRHPRSAVMVLRSLQRAPGRRVRRATLRNVSLPLAERMRASLLVPVAGGGEMRVSMADIEGRMLATSGVWEPQTLAALTALLGPGDVFVDLGANIGFFSLFASRLVGPTGRVYAVEPAPETYEELLRNLELNHAENVVPKKVAAGAAQGEAVLYDVLGENLRGAASTRRSSAPHGHAENTWAPVTVPVVPVTDVVDAERLAAVRLVKVDVEGAEADVLAGLDELFAAGLPRPSLLIEVHTQIDPGAPAAIADFSRRHGLLAYRIGDALTDDRAESARHLNASPMTVEELAATRDDYFYVVLTDETLATSLPFEALTARISRPATT